MAAFGFGQRVTGGGSTSTTDEQFSVTNEANSGTDTLDFALKQVAKLNGAPAIIIIGGNVTIAPRSEPHTIRSKNLTIYGQFGSRIMSNQLHFDCRAADNIILKNLTFEGTSAVKTDPRDAIIIDAINGRGPKGFWIDHCDFGAYFDLNITSQAHDLANANADPLLLTISNCLFHNENPDGNAHKNNGAVGIHGSRDKNDDDSRNRRTNAYATLYNNLFRTVRRRSPRSSGLCVVHAYNNVLDRWGAANTTVQVNGMESGHQGRLIAQANYFIAGPVTETIHVATDNPAGTLTIDDAETSVLKNIYNATAVKTAAVGAQMNYVTLYHGLNLEEPPVQQMTEARRDAIIAGAGANLT